MDWRCKILPVRVLGVKDNKGVDQDIADGIRWAAGLDVKGVPPNLHPADVIVLAFGSQQQSFILEYAIEAARHAGAIIVAAAGNENKNAAGFFPAGLEGVITVGAMEYSGKRARYSNYGSAVDLMAPGGYIDDILPIAYQNKKWSAGILGTHLDEAHRFGYRMLQGTSVAAPQVAGIVALLLAKHPSLNEDEVVNILKTTAVPLQHCPEGCGAGMVAAAAALETTENGIPKNANVYEWSSQMSCSYFERTVSNKAVNNKQLLLLLLLMLFLYRYWIRKRS